MFNHFPHPGGPILQLCRTRIPEMGDGRDGDDGRHDGVRDAGLLGHNAHANGQARGGSGWRCENRSSRLLPDATVIVTWWSPKVQPDSDSRGRVQEPI